ncbi:Outer membrane protein TolC [Granulicella rosea]|uniref:Outer membrane protein TolC n=1 Tax=Granulicella rosea TaxID=474952 RepID=A0A239M1C5_9BACT|nr:TolC family protein [Granulicella rosea]SNT36491.1 Outer membrane protein TolC [Granulicella rosea]
MRRLTRAASMLMVSAIPWVAAYAQQGTQPPPFTAPNPPTPSAPQSPGQQAAPKQQRPSVAPDAPLPQPDKSTVDLRDLPPMAKQQHAPSPPSPLMQSVAGSDTSPRKEALPNLNTHWYSLIGPYHAARAPELSMASPLGLAGMVRDGKLYLSLHDAIELAIQNNLDVEISRYNLLLADTDLTRARGGGSLRGLDYTIQQTVPGEGGMTSPLLITTTTGTNAPTSVNITDLSQVTQTGAGAQQTLSENGSSMFSSGPQVPLFDPVVTGQLSYFRRSDQDTLVSTSGTSTTSSSSSTDGASTSTPSVSYVGLAAEYQQGFSTGAQIDGYIDNSAQVLYASNSQYNPFHSPSSSLTLTQPLLRGRGSAVNLRFVHIAQIDRKVSRLLFEQQLLETIYGISRLYYDLVSLGENIGVKQESLAAAQKLYDDDKSQLEQGTLAPIEVTRAQALLSSSRLDLIQAQGEYRQQEAILREQLVRSLGDPMANVLSIVPVDKIEVPDAPPALDVPGLTQDALTNRPDLAQAGLQLKANEIAANGSRNNVRPSLNVYGNVQTRGSSLVPYQTLGSPGTGLTAVNPALSQGGLRLSTIYQGGLQLNMPLRNRIAQADSARDAIQVRQAQSRAQKLENDIRQQVENAAIALENAHQAYAAAVESRNFQQQLLQAEIDKFSVGASTNFLIVQDEAYLAQARSTEVAARSDWMKARLSLDRALGNLLESNHVVFDDAVQGKTP